MKGFEKAIKHSLFKYAMYALAVINLYSYITNKNLNCILSFVATIISTYYFIIKNISLSLLSGLIISSFVLGCGKILEGHSDETPDRVSQYETIQNEAMELFKKKNQDYGESFSKYGAVGVIARMGDKIGRLSSITKSSVTLVKTETIRDTLIDLHNYAALAIMLIDDEKKKEDRKTMSILL